MQDLSQICRQQSQSFNFKQFVVKMLFAVTLLLTSCNDAFCSAQLQQSFITPPPSARPWVYWFWVNGNITKEGITADLEAMQRVGVGGALIMHVGAGIPAGPVKFFSDEWRDLFKYAVSEADRLGLEITMNACDGWTGTGGPWIKPDEAMMQLTWTETFVDGPANTPLTLKKPKSKLNVYHDIAVLAFPAPSAENHDNTLTPSLSSNDQALDIQKLADGNLTSTTSFGSAKKQTWVQFDYAKPFTARGISFSIPLETSRGLPASAAIEYSDDRKHFKPVCTLNLRRLSDIDSVTFSFDETTSRCFRIVFPPAENVLSEIAFLTEARINDWQLKAGFARKWGHGADMPDFAMRKSDVTAKMSLEDPSWASKKEPISIDPRRIQNLSKHLNADTLDWQVPNGKWIILRIGYTPTGEKNGPASKEGTGLEPDALSPNGINIAFSRFMDKLLNDIGPLAGKALRYSHIDSWETGTQNWTAEFPNEFKKRRGYDLIPYLPVMAGGRIVDSVSVSERFLWDVRRTIADMLADYYYGRMSEVCHENGISFQTEAAGASQFLFDPITFQSRGDLPMGEFWVTEGRIRPDCKAAASAAHIFGKQFVGAEAFTSAPSTSRWSEHPYSLKALGDEAFCVGINRYVFHRYAMQPWLNVEPGMTMGKWGIHFERTNTWWDQGSSWMSYIARCQSLLQQGLFVGDVLYFSGEGAPNHIFGDRAEMNPALPYGYDFDACNADVLLNMTSVKDGKLVLSNGQQYSVLLLADERAMSPRLLAKIHEFVKEGAVVVGPKPLASPSLSGYPNCDKEVSEIADVLWGSGKAAKVNRKVGKGRVFWGLPFQEIFEKISVPTDFAHSLSQKSLRYIHRGNEEADWYFVSNQTHAPVETTCAFRCAGRQPELWNPETGTITKCAVYRFENGRTLMPLRLESAESAFVVFRTNDSDKALESVTRNGIEIVKNKLTDKPAEKNLRPAAGLEFGKKPLILYPEIKHSFTIAFWTKPLTAIDLPKPNDTDADTIDEKEGQQFVLYPEQGEIAYGNGHASAGISVGTNGICVFEHTSSYFPARLVHKTDIRNWTHVALVYNHNSPTIYINGIKVASANKSKYIVHPCGTTKIPGNSAVAVHDLRIVAGALSTKEIASLANLSRPQSDNPAIEILQNEDRTLKAVIWQSGKYSAISSNGTEIQIAQADIAEPIEVKGPWEVRFNGMGAPESTTFDKLKSWTESDQPAIKYYSGTAAYVNTIDLPESAFDKNRKLYLDLGNVQVIAELKINNQDLGILWKPPFRIDATNALHAGSNKIEIQVTNQWTNRLIGDEQFPPDCKYDNGRLVEWPQWFLNGQTRPQPQRLTFATWKHYDRQSHLSESGLLGPVVIRSVMVVDLPAPQD